MAQREQKVKPRPKRKTEPEVEEVLEAKSAEDLKAEMDELLDSIDEVLEENAEDFVKGYLQKGGQ